MPIDLDELRNRTTRQSVLGGHGLDVVNMHGSDFDALIAELRALRDLEAEVKRLRAENDRLREDLAWMVAEANAQREAAIYGAVYARDVCDGCTPEEATECAEAAVAAWRAAQKGGSDG